MTKASQEYIPNWAGIVDSDFSNRLNDVRIIGCTTVVLILVLAFVGMDWVTRVGWARLRETTYIRSTAVNYILVSEEMDILYRTSHANLVRVVKGTLTRDYSFCFFFRKPPLYLVTLI
jgi:hypothetical protein